MRPLCVKCEIQYLPKRNDIVVEEMSSFGSYKLWCADLFECPSCGHQLITGYGRESYGEHWQGDYPDKLRRAVKHGLYRCNEYHAPELTEAEHLDCVRTRGADKVIGDVHLIDDYRAGKYQSSK